MFAVNPITNCPHLPVIDFDEVYESVNKFVGQSCHVCQDSSENWICVLCKGAFCSRYVNEHMAEHSVESGHGICFSLSDASFWCYDCDNYITNNGLQRIARKFGDLKFPNVDTVNDLEQELSKLSTEEKRVSFSKEDLIAGLREKKYSKVCFLTGAGISVAAGIPDFRTPGTGLYSKVASLGLPFPEAVFHLDFLCRNPEAFYTVAKDFLDYNARPVNAHYFQKEFLDRGLLQKVYTQNIDGLELEAGLPLEFVVQAHGHMRTAHCIDCGAEHPMDGFKECVAAGKIYRCSEQKEENGTKAMCDGIIKPDIVFFGESLPASFRIAFQAIASADLVIIMGTSLKVYPFAALVSCIPESAPIVLMNRENSLSGAERDNLLFLPGDIESTVQALCDDLGWTLPPIGDGKESGK